MESYFLLRGKIREKWGKLYDVEVSFQFSCLPFRISSLFCIHNCIDSNGNRIKLIVIKKLKDKSFHSEKVLCKHHVKLKRCSPGHGRA